MAQRHNACGNTWALPLSPARVSPLQNWSDILTFGGGRYFLLPAASFLLALLLADPVVLLAVFRTPRLLQEPRYRLLANTLISDILYALVTFTLTATNVSPIIFPSMLCEALLMLQCVTQFASMLGVTAMGANIYLAVNWPLRYHALFPPSRALHAIAALWLLSAAVPVTILILMGRSWSLLCDMPVCTLSMLFFLPQPSPVLLELDYIALMVSCTLCFLLMSVCFYLLVWKTRRAGVWQGVPPRARQTISVHSLIFILYFLPSTVVIGQKLLLTRKAKDTVSSLYVSLTIESVVNMLPKALTPYLYGFRCAELSLAVRSLFSGRTRVVPGG
ncbi:probable G-protein coupled receptor 148 [Megalops cyprinoides]|uniref:probable G-protein coupled receptor 148 n=1 Tax=Megalops cyprinoides TaxID=118141 RepID=UPI001863BAC9|nr:probable G-protein coupled receptor 148 [Megalops cyprinoides]